MNGNLANNSADEQSGRKIESTEKINMKLYKKCQTKNNKKKKKKTKMRKKQKKTEN